MNSPFSLGRFEHDTRFRHAYFLPTDLYAKLATGVPTYLIGGRGTGKTTLLKAFEWRERLYNPFLQEALNGNAFADSIVGIYVKLSESHLKSFQRWFEQLESDQSAAIFGLYFDLLWLEDFAVAISELTKTQVLKMTVRAERSFIAALSETHLGRRLKIQANESMLAFSRRVQDRRFALYQAALVRQQFSTVVQEYPAVGPGEIGRTVAALFAEHAADATLGNHPATIRILIDEADALTEPQHVIVNSIIRLAKSPLSYIFSSIKRFRDVTTTTIPNMSVQRDDCQVVPLENPRSADFRKLAEGVATVRLRRENLGQFAPVDLYAWFGSSSINSILFEQLDDSLSAAAKSMLASAKQTGRLPYFGLPGQDSDGIDEDDETPGPTAGPNQQPAWDETCPIYQTHLIKRLGLVVPAADAPYHVRRQKYAEVRKRMVAAYLDICRVLNISPRYFGGGMILALSDSSVRDFLLQMNELFSESGRSVGSLAAGKLSTRAQDTALRRASDQKISTLPQWVRLPHEKVVKYIDTFGHLTHELQVCDDGVSHLLSSERGIFVLPNPQANDGLEEHRKVIEECIVTGYFSTTESNNDGQAFRVHKVLAPHYGFSYRGAYMQVPIKADHLKLIEKSTAASGDDPKKVARIIAAAIRSHDDVNQLKLF